VEEEEDAEPDADAEVVLTEADRTVEDDTIVAEELTDELEE